LIALDLRGGVSVVPVAGLGHALIGHGVVDIVEAHLVVLVHLRILVLGIVKYYLSKIGS